MASQTATVTSAAPRGNPADSMKSTWQNADRKTWTFAHHFFSHVFSSTAEKEVPPPVHKKTEKVGYVPEWHEHRWVLTHAAAPMIVHLALNWYLGHNLGALSAILLYATAFKLTGMHEVSMLRRVGQKYGFLDGDEHARDGVPDVGVKKVMLSLIYTSTIRPTFTVFLSYRSSVAPTDMNWWWLPLEIGLYGIILDFWFYWYHRLMHEVASLWKYHRTHHLTKHPNPLLTLYADSEQEFFDIAGIPLMTYFTMKLMGMPMSFYEWWICHMYVVFAELAGHSGVRLHAVPPSTLSWLLRLLDAELITEDHDMHHRKGWKSSGNYGKQTRLWDKVFGTCKDRVECTLDNVDWNAPAPLPWF